MKPPVIRIVIFFPACGAHAEFLHGGSAPVIGDIHDYGIARPTVSAVDERVAEPPVAWISHFRKALGADAYIRGDESRPLLPYPAFPYRKGVIIYGRDFSPVSRGYMG